jgi:RHS repeat-associated protein
VSDVADLVGKTAAPFENAPPASAGTSGAVSQVVGGVLGVVGAPAQIIDTAFAAFTSPIAAMFPAMPAVTLTGMHVGPPHGHTHPPSLIPPAVVPVPLPSLGTLVGAGSVTVLVGGMPAARAGDIGVSVTCGSLAPPFEVYTGSSNVFIGGARAARVMDITKHCNPTAVGAFDIVMGAAGAVAGAAGAISTGNPWAAIQAAADAATLALKALMGKDPGIPPGMGMIVGPPVPTVLIGGFPCPPVGQMAVGALLKAIKAAASKLRKSSSEANGSCGRAGEPVDVVTGANFTHFVDFVSGGAFEWRRHYTSARAREDGPLGRGWRHFFERSLQVRLHRATFTDWTGLRIEFPCFPFGEDVVRAEGRVLRRLARGHYRLSFRGQPDLEFAGGPSDRDLRLARLRTAVSEIVFEYDGLGRAIAATERALETGILRRFEMRYDPSGHLVQVLEIPAAPPGSAPEPIERVSYAYTADAELRRATDAMGGRWRYQYDAFHRLTLHSDPREYSFSYRYDTLGRCVETSGKDGLWRATIEYFPEKKFSRFTEGEGATWEIHYDGDGVITKIVDPYGGVKTRERDAEGRMAREVDSGGREILWLYDEDGAHYARQDRFGTLLAPEVEARPAPNPFAPRIPASASGRLLETGYWPPALGAFGCDESLFASVPPAAEAMARLCFTRRADGRDRGPATLVERDALGRRTKEVDAIGRTRTWRYDPTGNVIERSDRDGRAVNQRTASWNLLGELETSPGHAMRFEHSRLEYVTAVVDPAGNATGYDWDLKGRLVRVRRDGRVRDAYVYDAGDHFVEKRDGNGAVIFTNTIHENHFVNERRLASGGVQRFDYDARGRVTEASTDQHEVLLDQDFWGRRLRDVRDGAGIEHSYASAETGAQCSTTSTVFERFVSFVHRTANSAQLVDPAGRETWLLFRSDGVVIRVCPNGTTEILQYDGDGRLRARMTHGRQTGPRPSCWSDTYAYTAHGDLVQRDDSARGVTRFEVDEAHRLIAEITPAGERHPFWHDAADNLRLGWLEIGAGNRLVASTDERFAYDARDRLSERRRRDGRLVTYAYDSCDMLTRVDVSGTDVGTWSWSACYDGLGRRIATESREGRREFFWDGDRLAAEVLPGGGLRVYQYATPAALVPIGFVEYASREAGIGTGNSYFVFSDPSGMPLQIEDDQGQIVWWAQRVHPFGALEVRPGATIEYNLRWPGHYRDPATGLHYNRYRYYDPELGRYLQSDPLGYRGSPVNLYAYCRNPLVQIDVLGLHTSEDAGSEEATNQKQSTEEKQEEPPQKPPPEDPPPEPPRKPTLREATRAEADSHRNDPTETRPKVATGMETPNGDITTATSHKGPREAYHGLDGAEKTQAEYAEAAKNVERPANVPEKNDAEWRQQSGKCGEAQNMAGYERTNKELPPPGTKFDSANIGGPNSPTHGDPKPACPFCSYVQNKNGYTSDSGQTPYTTKEGAGPGAGSGGGASPGAGPSEGSPTGGSPTGGSTPEE